MNRTPRQHISMQTVAKLAGVSKATVSKVLNERPDVSDAARAKVHAACAQVGYRLNPSVQDLLKRGLTGHSQNIAFVLAGVTFANPSYAGIVDGISQGAQEHGLHLMLTHLNGRATSRYGLPPAIRDGRVAGMLLSGVLTPKRIAMLRETGLPFVVLGNYPKEVTAYSSSVAVDAESLMFQIVRAMKARGKRRIAFFHEDPRNYYAEETFAGFKRALAAHDLPFSENRVFRGKGGDFNALDVIEADLARNPFDFDAIVCLNYLAGREIACHLIAHVGREAARGILVATIVDYEHTLPIPTLLGENVAVRLGTLGLELLLEKLKHPEGEDRHVAIVPNLKFHGLV